MSRTDTMLVHGGAVASGTVEIRGSKNALPKIMVAAMLAPTPSEIGNVSWIRDTLVITDFIEACGGTIRRDGIEMAIDIPVVRAPTPDDMQMFHDKSRIPVLACGPLLHRCGEAFIAAPGGCVIGARPIDFHLRVLEALGAEVEELPEGFRLTTDRLRGAKIALPYPSVGATEQFLLNACVADGNSELANAAVEPEILDLVSVLQKMGALINVGTNRTINVIGVQEMHGFEHDVIPDRLEAASWASLALATNGEITISGVRQEDLSAYLNMYRRAGGDFEVSRDGAIIRFWRERSMLRPLAIETNVHPGFMTDWQSPFVTALTQADGITVAHETVYEDRMGYVHALRALGANVDLFTECLGGTTCRFAGGNHPHSAVIVGPTKLQGASLHVPDLRAGFSYVIAAAAAEGESTITCFDMLDRCYENLRDKLATVGVQFR